MILSTILYYLASSSAVLFYGIGINRTISINDDLSESLISCFKSLTTGISTAALSYLIVIWLLVPADLSELAPLVAILFFIIFTSLSEIFIGIGISKTPTEFSITLLSIFLGLNEGISLGYSVLITSVCIISFYFLVIIFHSVTERINFYTNRNSLKIYAILLLCLACAIIAICGSNSSWLILSLGGGAQ